MSGTKDDIITSPHPSLRKRSKKVGFVDDSVHDLIEKMESATIDWEQSREHEVGVALAAVQINDLRRVVVLREDYNDKNNTKFVVLINPEIVKQIGPVETEHEGCLSVRGYYGMVPRYHKVKVKALNVQGKEIRLTAEGFLARILQHEIDHTNGILFIDRIKDDEKAFYSFDNDGKITPVDYESEIANNQDLWPDED